ncbi:hypothetical protein [Hyalangium minutum]|uniref:Outer membrane protein beta-barrel domain-containing protein n=1 Tax=Hyalangium minutum TaxID=394096 RepID=A0A085WHN1_9BACT|nr:hypothetical protein [Hyalangium minutum]KFE67194.1 hypothetical protein DB31_8547 [Hyalangium minutum]
MKRPVLLLALVFALPVPVAAQGAAPAREEWSFGTVVAPAMLPEGASSVYGYIGVPEMGGGYRQGLSLFEIEARGRLDYFRLAGILEVGARKTVVSDGPTTIAPTLSLGLVFNSGSAYLDADNFGGTLVRITPGLIIGWRVADTVMLLGLLDLPVDLGLDPTGARRFQALTGGGAEFYLGSGISLLTAGQIGVESFKAPLKDNEVRLGYQVRLGIGTRLF